MFFLWSLFLEHTTNRQRKKNTKTTMSCIELEKLNYHTILLSIKEGFRKSGFEIKEPRDEKNAKRMMIVINRSFSDFKQQDDSYRALLDEVHKFFNSNFVSVSDYKYVCVQGTPEFVVHFNFGGKKEVSSPTEKVYVSILLHNED
jgi:hypothetical protein